MESHSKVLSFGCGAIWLRAFALALILASAPIAYAAKTYQQPAAFVKEQLGGSAPKASFISLSGEMQKRISKMNGRPYGQTRIRYWKKGNTSVWILNDIGKTKPITTGYVIKEGKIVLVKVLTYRESHGDEVTRSFFTKQFKKAALKDNGRLSKRPRNIAGATLSVRSLTRMARVALYLDQQRKCK